VGAHARADGEAAAAAPRLLPPFDPYLLGWADRNAAVPDALRTRVFAGGGMFRATAVDDGRVVGTWTRAAGRVRLADGADARTFADEVADVQRFLEG
jgi:winged helix DNA-binding protein